MNSKLFSLFIIIEIELIIHSDKQQHLVLAQPNQWIYAYMLMMTMMMMVGIDDIIVNSMVMTICKHISRC